MGSSQKRIVIQFFFNLMSVCSVYGTFSIFIVLFVLFIGANRKEETRTVNFNCRRPHKILRSTENST